MRKIIGLFVILKLFIILGLSGCTSVEPSSNPPKLDHKQKIFTDDFSHLDETRWIIEMEQKGHSRVYAENNRLVLNTFGGVTVWFNQPLSGDYVITYKRGFIFSGGENDRLSDLNQFWLAFDPQQSNLFTRSGALAEYDNVNLWYMGMGGNYNETTRFRWYDGTGERHLLQEFLSADALLKKSVEYEVITQVKGHKTRVWINGELLFEGDLRHPDISGYFGFRSTYSHQYIKDFAVYRH